ncbi:MAG: DUF3592 domain-containing protein [Anaerolineae bacterium]
MLRSFWGLIALILVLIGAPFFLIGLSETLSVHQQLSSWTVTRGIVVENSYQSTEIDGQTSAAYLPVVEYTLTPGASPVRFTDSTGTLPPEYAIGAQVEVMANPNDAYDARIISWTRLWLVPTILMAVGLLPIGVFLSFMGFSALKARRALALTQGDFQPQRFQ